MCRFRFEIPLKTKFISQTAVGKVNFDSLMIIFAMCLVEFNNNFYSPSKIALFLLH